MTHRRTPVHIDRRYYAGAACTVSGVNLPERSVYVGQEKFPEGMWAEVEPGKVFFAYANLAAEHPEDVDVRDIEREWGNIGPLHFEA